VVFWRLVRVKRDPAPEPGPAASGSESGAAAASGSEPAGGVDGQSRIRELCIGVERVVPEGFVREIEALKLLADGLWSLAFRAERVYCGDVPREACLLPEALKSIAEEARQLSREASRLLEKRMDDLEARIPRLLQAAVYNAVAERLGLSVRKYPLA